MKKQISLIFLLVFLLSGVAAQPEGKPGASSSGELTIYLIPSNVTYNWSSPHALYCSLIRNYIRNIFKKDCYLLGHAFMELESPSDSLVVMTGMRSTCRDQQKQMLFEENYGLAILGTGLEGKLQTREELECQLGKYSKKGKLAFIRILINEKAALKMGEFYNGYKSRLDSIGNSTCYGGAYWPRYYGEGSGCSAFVISFLDIAGILREEFDIWRVDINIPYDLIGGPYNPGQEVTLKDVKKSREWADNSVQTAMNHEPFWIFDPTMMSEWVTEVYKSSESVEGMTVIPVKINKAKGIEIDARNVTVPDESIFMPRKQPSIFIKE